MIKKYTGTGNRAKGTTFGQKAMAVARNILPDASAFAIFLALEIFLLFMMWAFLNTKSGDIIPILN